MLKLKLQINHESESESEVAQLCPTLCNPMDGSLPGSEVHGIFQARILEWATISFSRGSSQPRDWTKVSCIADRRFAIWAAAAAAAANLLQSCLTLCDPIDSSPPGSPVPGILQARILEWVAISSSSAWKWKIKVKSLSRVQLFTTYQASVHGICQARVLEWGAIAFSDLSH